MTTNDKYRELISRYVDHELTSPERKIAEQLLAEDPELQAYYQELRQLDQVLNQCPAEQVSPDWERRISAALRDVDVKEGTPMKKTSLFRKSVSGGMVIALLIVGLIGLQTYAQRSIQGRIAGRWKSTADDIGDQYSPGNSGRVAYAPYYLETGYQVADGKKVAINQPTAGVWTMRDEEELIEYNTPRTPSGHNTEEYARIYENPFLAVTENPLSTFSIDVDTGAYSNIRRFLNQGQLPPADAVRIEEMLNYFSYNYRRPTDEDPFSINIDGATCPWNPAHQLVRIGLQGKTLSSEEVPPSNLVFLIDVSGSMSSANKLPLLKESLKMMVRQLSADQRVAIVVYAGAAGKVLESTPGSDKRTILAAIDRLSSGGSTAGGAGIKLAYQIARDNFIPGGNNRVILATDGDFNVGVSSTSEMTRLIEERRRDNIFITVLGFGMGNYKDNRLEQIANKGNGTYHYIDNEREARKVLVDELGSTLFTIAKDVKLQIEFNPAQVKAYRLIGYENRMLAKEDFNDDTKDAGELGAGHTVTALYELIPAGSAEHVARVDDLTYQKSQPVPSEDLMTVKLRYKAPDRDVSRLITESIRQADVTGELSGDFQFAAAVAEFGLILRDSQFKAGATYQQVLQSAAASKGPDRSGYRQEFLDLVRKAQSLDHRPASTPQEYWYDDEPPSSGLRFKND